MITLNNILEASEEFFKNTCMKPTLVLVNNKDLKEFIKELKKEFYSLYYIDDKCTKNNIFCGMKLIGSKDIEKGNIIVGYSKE